MNSRDFYNNFNETASELQMQALQLTQNMEDARFLYQETAHRAIQNQSNWNQKSCFKFWISDIMHSTFSSNFR